MNFIIAHEEDDGQRPTWRKLLNSRGATLWSVRHQLDSALGAVRERRSVIGGSNKKEVWTNSYLKLPMHSKPSFINRILGRRAKEAEHIVVVTCPHLFSKLEQEQDRICGKGYHGLDKPDTRGQAPRPLTRCTHDQWTRQRTLVERAFLNLPHRSLEAAKCLLLDDILKLSKKEDSVNAFLLDWKEVAVTVALQWAVQLFNGCRDTVIEHHLLEFWKVSRRDDPIPASVLKRKRQDLAKCLRTNPNPVGVMDSLFECGLSVSESHDNCINAMIAALDATQSLLFWTMWNLARRPDCWKQARDVVSNENFQQTFHSDLDNLGSFKKASTRGEIVDYSGLSFLGRALCETVRVFPPVWTLPRTWPSESNLVELPSNTRWSKLDVAIVNGADSPGDWDPNNTRPSHIASFGLGRRHCPAGSAALHAVYFFLYQFIDKFERFEEDVPGKAMDKTCLLPTLSVIGQQYFRVQLAESS